MKNTQSNPLICIVIVLLFAACASHVVAVGETSDVSKQINIFNPIGINYHEGFVCMHSYDPATDETTLFVIFTDNRFFSHNIFLEYFEAVVTNHLTESKVDIVEITGFGNIDGTDYFAKWTPEDGYRYYPLA